MGLHAARSMGSEPNMKRPSSVVPQCMSALPVASRAASTLFWSPSYINQAACTQPNSVNSDAFASFRGQLTGAVHPVVSALEAIHYAEAPRHHVSCSTICRNNKQHEQHNTVLIALSCQTISKGSP